MISHSDKETSLHNEDTYNTNNKNENENEHCGYLKDQEQYEHWARTLTFPSYVIQEYKKKYPTTFAELRIDGLNKQQIARYIYHKCETIDIYEKYFTKDYQVVSQNGMNFVNYLSRR